MHACAARRCFLHAWHGSPPPRLSASTTGFLTPGPLAEPWRGLHVPGVPWVFVRLRTTRNAQKHSTHVHRGTGKALCTPQNTRGRGTRGKQTNQPLSCKGGPTCSHKPPPPPGHIGTLAHWHIGTKACSRAGLFCQFRLARSSRRPQAQAGRQAANKQTNTPLIGQCGVSKARSAKLKKPKERPTACQHYGQVRSLAVRSQIDRQTQVLASQPASQQARRQVGAGWLTGVVVVALGVGQHAGQVDHHAPGGCDTACDLYLLPI